MLLLNSFCLFFSLQNFQTQFYYIITFFLNHSWWNYFFIFFLGLIYFKRINFFFFYYLLFSCYSNPIAYKNIPFSLLIGYNNIHPLLFYNVLISFFLCLYTEVYFIKKKKFILNFSIITLLLGGLWGMGNSVWGFFWVNDQIEFVLLLYILLQLIQIHFFFSKKVKTLLVIFFISILNYLLILRWGFVFTRHNFINLKFFINFFKFNFFFFFKFNFFFFALIICVNKLKFIIINYLIIKNSKFFSFFFFIFHLTIFILFITWLKYKIMNNTIFQIKYTPNFIFFINLNCYLNFFFFFLKKKLLQLKIKLSLLYTVKFYFFVKNIFVNYLSSLFFFFLLKSNLRFILAKYIIKSSRRWI